MYLKGGIDKVFNNQKCNIITIYNRTSNNKININITFIDISGITNSVK